MKKRAVIKQRNKLNVMKHYHYLKYAHMACILIVVLFLLYTASLTQIMQISYQELISQNAIVITGFVICMANLYIWYVLKSFLKQLQIPEHIESIRMNLIMMALAQLVLMNFISAFLMLLALIKYFQWGQFSLRKAFQELYQEEQLPLFLVTLFVLSLFILLVFGIYFTSR